MGMDVRYATDVEALVDRLVGDVEQRRRAGEPGFIERWSRSTRVLVPTPDMGDWLELAVARRSGAAVNYRFDGLQGFLSGYVEGASGEEISVVDREALRALLVETFAEPDRLDGPLAPVGDYITAGRGDRSAEDLQPGDERAVETRRYQLAARLAMLFEEYTIARPGLLEGWESDPPVHRFQEGEADSAAQTERWQSALWRRLCERTPLGETLLPLPRAFDRFAGEVRAEVARRLDGGALHVFGFPRFGGAYLRMLGELAEAVDLRVYVSGPGGRDFVDGARGAEQPWVADCPDDLHPALRNWAGHGAETLARLDRLADTFEVLDEPTEPAPQTRLGRLQRSIRRSNDLVDTDDGGPDGSLQLHEAAGMRREVETVAGEIWQRVAEREEVQFSDIALAVPPGKAETYLAHVESVFSAFRRLPYTINSMSLEGRSPVLDAADLLLNLPFGDFTRAELLSLVVHPNVRGRFEEVDEETWVGWVEDLNILYGADRREQRRDGRHYLSGDLFNWDQGLRRLALGVFRDVADDRADAVLEVGGHSYLPESVATSETDAASALNTLVRSLVEDALWLRDHRAGLGEWADILSDLVETYLVPEEQEGAGWREDRDALDRVVDALDKLGEGPDIGPVGVRTAYLFASDRLSGLQTGAGSRFTGGVVVSTPDRLRGIPFEHLFVVGMGEGIYPATDAQTELDLRLRERRLGDLRASERDRYHFLEMLQSARRSVTLSWVGREPTTGEALPASSLVADLRRMVPGKAEAWTTVHPLRRYDRHGDYFERFGLPIDGRPGASEVSTELGPNYHPEAFREAQMSAIRERLEAAGGGRSGPEIWTGEAYLDAQRRLFDAQGDRSRPLLRMIGPGRVPEAEEAEVHDRTLRVSRLVGFLKTPLQTKAKELAGIYDGKGDALAEEHEPFGYDHLSRAILMRGAVRRALADAEWRRRDGVAAETYAEGKFDFAPGDLPVEIFAEPGDEEMVGLVAQTLGPFEETYLPAFDLPAGTEAETPSVGGRPDDLTVPAIEVPASTGHGPMRVELSGDCSPMVSGVGEEGAPVDVLLTIKRKGETPGPRDFLRPYISHLIMSAAEELDPTARWGFAIRPKEDGWSRFSRDDYTVRFPELSADRAREELCGLVRSIYDDEVTLLPIEVVAQELEALEPFSRAVAWRHAIEEDSGRYGRIQTTYGPVHDYLDYPPPEDPVAAILERFRYHPVLGGPN